MLCYSITCRLQVIKMQVFFTSQIKQLLQELKVTLNSSVVCSPVCYLLLPMIWTTQCQNLHLTFSSQATIRSTIKHIFVPFWLLSETHVIVSSSLASCKNAQWPGNLPFGIVYYLNLKQKIKIIIKKSRVYFPETSTIL